jgi:hypothetical protein
MIAQHHDESPALKHNPVIAWQGRSPKGPNAFPHVQRSTCTVDWRLDSCGVGGLWLGGLQYHACCPQSGYFDNFDHVGSFGDDDS